MANIAPFELTEAFTMENFNKRIQTANTEINNLNTNKQNKDTAITTANIGSQSVNYANTAHGLRTYNASGTSYGTSWIMNVQRNKTGDNMFRIYCGDASVGVSVNRADIAGNADLLDGYHADELIAAASAAASSLVFGTYTGDSAKSRFFNLGFAPKGVLVCSQEGIMGVIPGSIYIYGGLALPGAPVKLTPTEEVLVVTDTGFSINALNDYCRINQKGNIYRYFAVK